jgi:hypothetical protein
MEHRDIVQEILDGIREIKAFHAGEGKLRQRELLKIADAALIPLSREVRIEQPLPLSTNTDE